MQGEESKTRAEKAIERWHELKAARSFIDHEREELIPLFAPWEQGVITQQTPDQAAYRRLMSSAPPVILRNFVTGTYATMNNPTSHWFDLEPLDEEFHDYEPAMARARGEAAIVRKSFSPDVSTFYESSLRVLMNTIALGNGPCYDELDEDKGRFIDKAIPMRELVVCRGIDGQIDEAVRRYCLKPAQALREFGGDALPSKVQEMAEKSPNQWIWFYHWAYPNDDYTPETLGVRGKPFASISACEVEKHLISISGYFEMPYYYPGWSVIDEGAYSRGLAHDALFSARRLNYHDKDMVQASALAASPPMAVPNDRRRNTGNKLTPGGVYVGGMTQGGTQTVRPIYTYQGFPVSSEMYDRAQQEIRDALFWASSSLVGRTGLTDVERLQMEAERLRSIAPFIMNIFGQYHLPKIKRRHRMLRRAGQFAHLARVPELENRPMGVRATTAADLAQRSGEAVSARFVLDDTLAAMQVDPSAGDLIDVDQYVRIMRRGRGAPGGLLRGADDVAALREARQQQQAAQQAAEAAPGVADALASLAEAGGGQ